MTREEKKQQVAEWQERLSAVKSAILTDFRGLNVAQMTELRSKLREQGVEYHVAKNTLLRRAVADIGLSELHEHLSGPTGIAYSYKDSIEPAKRLKSFAQQNAELRFKGGILEGKVIDAKGAQCLASLPGREVLIAQFLAGFQSPLIGLVNVLQANLRRLLIALEAIKQQKQGE